MHFALDCVLLGRKIDQGTMCLDILLAVFALQVFVLKFWKRYIATAHAYHEGLRMATDT